MRHADPRSDGAEARRGVLDEVLAFNADRKPKRVKLKLRRMDASPFAFFRGTAHLFARSWAELRPADPGPAVLLCGDLHLENFGAYRSDDGDFLFDINDFDEALVAPAGLDLVRCAASILLAAEEWRLSPLHASGMVLAYLGRYRAALGAPAGAHRIDLETPRGECGGVGDLLGATALGTQAALLESVTEPVGRGRRRIVRAKGRRVEVGARRREEIRAAFDRYGEGKPNPGAYKVLDVVGRIAGIGSLGLRRYLALIEGHGPPDRQRILDIKEERPSAMGPASPGLPAPAVPGGEAGRVVAAQRQLQAKPTLGLDVIEVAGEPFRLREMIPEENRSSLDRLRRRPGRLRSAVEIAGELTGWSHLRGAPPGVAGDLAAWSSGPALDAVLAAAARVAERTRVQYAEFHAALRRTRA